MMAHPKPKHLSAPYRYSLLSDYCNNVNLKERLSSNYETLKPCQETTLPFEGQMGCSRVPVTLEKPETSCQPNFGLKPTPYSKVHPKKKLRMAYDKELADAHSSLNSVSRIKKEGRTDPLSSVPVKKCYTPTKPFLSNQEEARLHYSTELGSRNPQTKFETNARHSITRLPELIPINTDPFLISSSLTLTSPNSPGISLAPFRKGADYGQCNSLFMQPRVTPPGKDSSNDKPQDLRVSFNEGLKNVARSIWSSHSIPELNYQEIPKIVSTYSAPLKAINVPTAVNKHGLLDERDRRMSREAPSPHSSLSSPSIMPNSPECNGSCSSSGYSDSFPPHSTIPNNQRSFQVSTTHEFPSKDPKWPETDNYQPPNDFASSEKNRPSLSNQLLEDPVAYLHKPIEKWSYADVIFFLMEACNELRINPGGVKFKSSDNGSVLLRMIPSDFDILAPGHGQKLYDYFINFKTQNYMASSQNIQGPYYSYNYKEGNTQCAPLEHPHPSHQQHVNLENIYSPHHYQPQEALQDIPPPFENFQSSPCNSSGPLDSPLNEYVPQGSHYMESLSDPMSRRAYDLPSAASKTFPPLHNYDESLSDPDEIEEETPPEPPKKRGPGRPPKPESERKRKPKKTGRLWEFIRNLLLDPKTCPSLLRWEDAQEGIFRIVQSDAIANKWGMRKNNEKMNYEKLSRAMRYYYKAKIFEPVLGKRLVYKFGSNAKGWRPLNPNNPNFQN